jgi:hypothetical protein
MKPSEVAGLLLDLLGLESQSRGQGAANLSNLQARIWLGGTTIQVHSPAAFQDILRWKRRSCSASTENVLKRSWERPLEAWVAWAREAADRPDPLPLVLAEVAGGGSSNRSGRRRPASGELSVSIRRRALTPVGARRSARVLLDSADGRTLGTMDGLAPSPLSNRLYRPQRKHAALPRCGQPHGRLRLGSAKALAQRPAKRRGFRRWVALSPRILGARRLVGGAGSPARTRLSTPNSLIYGKIQGIRADSGSAGLATGPDSLACTRTCAPRSLEPGTGNFVPRSRDSRGLDPLRKVPDLTPVFRAAATPLEFHVARERFVWIGFFGLAAASGRFESNAFKKLPQE